MICILSPAHTLKMTNNLLADAFIGQVTSPEVARIKAFFCGVKLLHFCLISFLHWALQSSQPVSQVLFIICATLNASNLGTATHYRSRLTDLFFLSPDIFSFTFFERFIIRSMADVIKLTGIEKAIHMAFFVHLLVKKKKEHLLKNLICLSCNQVPENKFLSII